MLQEKVTTNQREYEIALIEELVPEDHLLRKIDAAVISASSTICARACIRPTSAVLRCRRSFYSGCCFWGIFRIKSEVKLADGE